MSSEKHVVFLGDELVAGLGDPRAQGWVGRVMAHTYTAPPILAMPLVFAHATTAQLADTGLKEAQARYSSEADSRLVIGLGSHDIDAQISLARSRLYLANLLDDAARTNFQTYVVGPPPRYDVPAEALERMNQAFLSVCARRQVPYVNCFDPLFAHEQWRTDMYVSRSYTPRQAGYALMAWLVMHTGWHEWLGVTPLDE
ncbi:MAG: GDSL-type esterase/lipase family protein [Actinomycetaceae bacterium]|nr:GDSL-type esterase/lipase family protein [Actinomycetaceae bacterium]MDY6082748.1 GDSL-type esterase/lipase family protein [Actinomycetaceae bacterium]